MVWDEKGAGCTLAMRFPEVQHSKQGNRCNMGSIGEKGFYNHKKRLGQASQEEVSGPGRAAYKSSVPLELDTVRKTMIDHLATVGDLANTW